MKSTICALNVELEEAKKMLADNQTLVIFGAQFSKLGSIKKQPSSLSEDICYAMSQAVITKGSPEAISHLGGLIVCVILASLVINNNNIISDASKGISEELSKAFDLSLNQIDNYRSYGEGTLLIVQTTDSGGCGVTNRLSSELKNVGCISF